MPRFEMKASTVASVALHAAVLGWALISFSSKSFEATPPESMPVDIISADQFSKITKGVEKAKPSEKPKPFVETKAEQPKPVDDMTPKVVEKKEEVKPTTQQPQPEKPPEKKVEPKQEQKSDPIAEAIKKEEKKPDPPKPKKPEPKFDPNKIAALLDKRTPQRTAAAGDVVNTDQSLGRANATAVKLSQSELDAMRRRISECWNPPVGAENAQNLVVVFRVIFNANGTIKEGPDVIEGPATNYGAAVAESAKRAILQCQPYTMLRPETFSVWRDMEVGFNPSDMFRN
ncbi:MAG TPA: protein TolA [Pseudolabrys sp.]|nr:protein TolA [Pseudolabrys sp.]